MDQPSHRAQSSILIIGKFAEKADLNTSQESFYVLMYVGLNMTYVRNMTTEFACNTCMFIFKV